MRILAALAFALFALSGCGDKSSSKASTATPNLNASSWAKDAVWYQIFVERFRNGDSRNDPTAHDIEGVTDEKPPAGWAPTPWTGDWYAVDPWAKAAGKDFYGSIQTRRYGGDLQGVLDQLDYLQTLGVTALFLNPINDAPSLHKYDARNYTHIDRNFGPDPRGDEALAAGEDPADPKTWHWSAADSLFLKLVNEVHRRGMRIIMDYSWNHTGITFWAWKDVLKNQQASKYAGWYEVERFDDPATPDTNEFKYRGWAGVPWLPEWKKIGRPAGETKGPIPGNLVPEVKQMVFDVTRRWLDPNGDGNPADGVDGFRLDVADVVPLGFWRDYRTFVRGINPDAYLVGEVWWEQWPDKLWDPAPWLKGDVFDAVMHYQWYSPTRSFFASAPPNLTATQYRAAIDSLGLSVDSAFQRDQMNLTASHDTPRTSTSIYNGGKYKYHENPREDTSYKIDRPDEPTRRVQELILLQQFTFIGAPHIWYGDEVGMFGADDPDERKPMVWSDLKYDDEAVHPVGKTRRRNKIEPDTALFAVYQRLVALRKEHLRLLVDGGLKWLVADDAHRVIAYERSLGNESAVIAFNASDRAQVVKLGASGNYRMVYPKAGELGPIDQVEIPAMTGLVWVR